MQFKYLSDLKLEFKKYTGFMTPDAIKDPSTEAVTFLSNPDICLPIDDTKSPLLSAFSAILGNKKMMKNAYPLISTFCLCLKSEAITGDAFLKSIQLLEETATQVDNESAIMIIQLSTSTVVSRFLEVDYIQSILSLLLAFVPSDQESIRTAACAAFNQVLDAFVTFATNKNDTISPVAIREIDRRFNSVCESTIEFTYQLYKIFYLILRDITRLCNAHPAVWIHHREIPLRISFSFLENIISHHSSVLMNSPHFLQLIQNAMISVDSLKGPISFSVVAIETFMEKLPDACRDLFASFLRNMEPEMKGNKRSLLFYRIFLFRKDTTIMQFYTNCDKNGELLVKLIQKLKKYVDLLIKESNIELSTAPYELNIYKINPRFSLSAPVEISIYFLQACFQASGENRKNLFSMVWSDILAIISISVTSVLHSSSYVLMQNLHLVINLAAELELDECRGAAIGTICTVLMNPNADIGEAAFNTLSYAIESTPTHFRNYWHKLVSSLSEYKWKPESYKFSTLVCDEQIIDMILALLALNDGAQARPWALTFMSNVIVENTQRFTIIWPKIEEKFLLIIDDSLTAFSIIMENCFNEKTEGLICNSINSILAQSKSTRAKLLEYIAVLLSKYGGVIKDGWPSIISGLSSKNFSDDKDILNSGFKSLNIICNDLLFALPKEIQKGVIDLIFDYAHQDTDINVSLLAFGILWNVISIAKSSDIWIQIIDGCKNLISDARNEVSLCAVKAYFNIIVSDAKAFEKDVFEYLANESFPAILDILSNPPDDSESTQQLAFHELAHCRCALWDELSEASLWPRMIEDQRKFMESCTKRDPLVSSFQFFNEMFLAPELSDSIQDQLFDSLDKLATVFINRENPSSAVFGAFGHMIREVFPTQKERYTTSSLQKWLDLMEKLILDLECDQFLPPTTHKSLDSIQLLFPLQDDFTIMIYKMIIRFAANDKNSKLVDVALRHIQQIIETKVPSELIPTLFVLSKDIFSISEAHPILSIFLEVNAEIKDDLVEQVCEGYIDVGNKDPELKIKSGQAVFRIIKRVSDELKQRFVVEQKDCFPVMKEFWTIFLDPRSPSFDDHIAVICSRKVISVLSEIMPTCESDDLLSDILTFLSDVRSYAPAFGRDNKDDVCHLKALMLTFADLVLHPNDSIRKIIRSCIILMNEF